ncbi:MAG: TIGR04086 family membrane protein [Ruminococcus sp.]|nr:TIGR04086 family membrane protein [Ruminococcus sp.]
MRRHRQSLWTNVYLSFGAALLWGIACMLALALIFSTISYTMLKTLGFIDVFTLALLITSAYSSGYIYGRFRRRKGLFHGAVCGMLLYAALSAAGFFISGHPADIRKLPLLLLAAAAGGVAGVNSKRPKNLTDQ